MTDTDTDTDTDTGAPPTPRAPITRDGSGATRDLVAEVSAAVQQYDRALAEHDLAALSEWFDDSPSTLRADAHGVLVGRESIDAFRRRSGGAPPREVRQLHVVPLGEGAAMAVAETVRADGTRGLQTQAWVKRAAGWRISVAHVSTSPAAPAPAGHAPAEEEGQALWRVRGEPLVRGAGSGRLQGRTMAVKDLFAVQGHRVGAGNPAWLAEAPVEGSTAPVLQSLLDEGADVSGIVQTDEFAYSLGGTNAHYGTPTNPAAPGRVPGGSSSGPASAVALGLVDVGLGTDTAGSIRVPASYCGLFGFRPSHGLLSTRGLLELAPSFDTVGWLARDAETLSRVGDVLLPPTGLPAVDHLLLAEDLFGLAEPAVQSAVRWHAEALSTALGLALEQVPSLCEGQLDAWLDAFRTVQAAEAWVAHGAWLSRHPDVLEPEILGRFEQGRAVTAEQRAAAERVLVDATAWLRDRLPPGTVLLQPATSTTAPPATLSGEEKGRMRAGTLRLTCPASVAGLPALTVPGPTVDQRPVGLCLVGARGWDGALVGVARAVPAHS